MSEKTLTDVIERMRAEGDLSRNSGTHSIKSVKQILLAGQEQSLADKENAREQKRVDAKQIDLLEQMASNGKDSNSLVSGATLPKGGMGGLGLGLLGAGVGLGAAGAGLGAFFMGLAGAEAVMSKFGSGENLKKLITNLGDGLSSLETRDLAAIGAVLGFGAVAGAVPGLSGAAAGMGMASVGLGIASFFVGLGAADAALAWMSTDYSSLPRLTKMLSETVANIDNDTMITLGVLLGTAGVAGAVFGMGKSAKAAAGLALVGGGIAAFFIALGAADATLGWMKPNYSGLKNIMVNFSEGMSALTADPKVFTSMAVILGGAAGAGLFGVGKTAGAALGMGLIGAGIGAFFVGLGAADKALSWMDIDGISLRFLMENIAKGLSAFSGGQLAGLAVLLGGTGIFAASGVGLVGVALGATGIGLLGVGLGAFIAGIGAGDAALKIFGIDGTNMRKLMVNIATGLGSLNELDASNLAKLVIPLSLIGPAMVAFLAGDGLIKLGSGVMAAVDKVWSWLTGRKDGKKSPGMVEQVVAMLEPLNAIDATKLNLVEKLGVALNSLGLSMSNLQNIDLGDLKSNFKDLAKAMEYSMPLLNGMYEGKNLGSGYFDGTHYDFRPGLKNLPLDAIVNRMTALRSALDITSIDSIDGSATRVSNELQAAQGIIDSNNNNGSMLVNDNSMKSMHGDTVNQVNNKVVTIRGDRSGSIAKVGNQEVRANEQ
jgi:hypothetical protein